MRRVRSPTSNVSRYYHILTFYFQGLPLRPGGSARVARCHRNAHERCQGWYVRRALLGSDGQACVGLHWEALVFVLLRVIVCNILAGPSLMQRRHIRHENSFAMLVCSQVILSGANGDF